MDEPLQLVREYVSSPAKTIRTSTPLSEILGIFEHGRTTGLPVLDDDGRLAGIVSTTDVVRRLTKPLDESITAATLMSKPAVMVAPGESLDVAAWRMVAGRAHRLVVIENDRLIGVLSADAILRGLVHRHVIAPLRSIMSAPVESVMLGAPIEEAIGRLVSAGVHGLVVLDGEKPVGVFDHTDALAARRLPPSLLQDPVEELMCDDIVVLDASTPIHRAARYAWTTKAHRVLVTDRQHLVGIVSELDLIDALARKSEDAAAAS